MVKLSIVLPIYNVEKYLPKCLDCLLNQTLRDIEIICVNDESTDNSLEILNDYAKKDERIKIINQSNAGPGVARNNGIYVANGEYIAFCDPDDWIDENAYEYLYNKAKANNADVVEYAVAVHEEKNGKIKIKDNLYDCDVVNITEKPHLLFKGVLASWNKLCLARLIKEQNILFSEGYCAEDMLFTISLKSVANKILYTNKPFYHYLHRKSSITHKKSATNYLVPFFIADVLDFLQKKDIYNKVVDDFWNFAIGIATLHYRKLPNDFIKPYKQKCKEIMPEDVWLKFDKYTREKSFRDKIFSIRFNGKVYEMTILGLKIKYKKHHN